MPANHANIQRRRTRHQPFPANPNRDYQSNARSHRVIALTTPSLPRLLVSITSSMTTPSELHGVVDDVKDLSVHRYNSVKVVAITSSRPGTSRTLYAANKLANLSVVTKAL